MTTRPGLLERPFSPWAVAGLMAILFAATNLPWHLDDYDQAKQAYTSLEMIDGGHWMYQHTPNQKVASKPPFVGWISAALYTVSRSWEFAWRGPSLLAAATIAFLLFWKGMEAYGAIPGLIALAAFGLNGLSPRLATLVRTDMPLALVIFLLGLQIWQKVRSATPWSTQDRMVAFLLLAIGMLIKGPIVFAMLLPGIIMFQIWKRRRAPNTSAWSGWNPWLVALLVFGLWALGGIIFVSDFYRDVVEKEFLGRFGGEVHRPQPIYFYLPHLLWRMAPWSLLLIGLAVLRPTGLEADEKSGRAARPDMAWLIFWVLGALLVMSLIPSKRVDRIFPVVPPICFLLAAVLGQVSARDKLRAKALTWTTIALLLACVAAPTYTGYKVVRAYREDRAALVRFAEAVRQTASEHKLRYGVVGKRHEGLLLYLRRLRFLSPEEAVVAWEEDKINAVVAPVLEQPRLLRDLEGAVPAMMTSRGETSTARADYVLLVRSGRVR